MVCCPAVTMEDIRSDHQSKTEAKFSCCLELGVQPCWPVVGFPCVALVFGLSV